MKWNVALILMLLALPALAEEVLLDAETDAELLSWKCDTEKLHVVRSSQLATRGVHSLRLSALDTLESCSLTRKLGVVDWSEYESLALDVFNEGQSSTHLRVSVDTILDDARRDYHLPAGRWLRIVYPVIQMDPERADIRQTTKLTIQSSGNRDKLALYLVVLSNFIFVV